MAKEIKRILIANRGEIVLRAIRAIKEMGKEAIVVYSTADKDALYVKLADLAICIGSPKSSESYLNIPAIISASEIANADAIFPGYGFLSENQNFVEICAHHNIVFIGPKSETMQLMSDKSKAKDVMKQAGVPVIPGSEGALKDIEDAKNRAKEIGYPVILKAASGGGGRGMRVVEKEEDIENLFLAAESEALNSFGDGRIYIEKYIKNPRHIEVQIVADAFGNVIHLGERDCSLQRRHQKLIEETPANFLRDEVRTAIHQSAVQATKYINYQGAGTFEFLVDADQNFYFMEMNTRLQVEHTVSEMVSNRDIIKMMIDVAEGKKLPHQDEIQLQGHSIECRITAEDPKTFLPSPGRVTKWILPGGKDVRVDTHVYQDYIIPPYYDSMIAKLIVYSENREEAIKKIVQALNEFQVAGIKTTIDFHKKMMKNEDFLENNFDTKYLENQK
jgi:acetyl-CoA carboxylase biotin carboxylase subunit